MPLHSLCLIVEMPKRDGSRLPQYVVSRAAPRFNMEQELDFNPATRWSPENSARVKECRRRGAKPQRLIPADRTIQAYNVEGALFSPTELQLPNGLSEQEWMSCLQKLDRVHESSGWWIGDCLNYGIIAFGKRVSYDLAIQATGLGWETLRAYARTCREVPPERRKAGVALTNYRVVSAFPPEQQDKLLDEAQELGLTALQFVEHVRQSEGAGGARWNAVRRGRPCFPGGKHSVRIFLDRELYEQVRELAQNTTVEEFLREVIGDYVRAALDASQD
jgi:hypothetical protein